MCFTFQRLEDTIKVSICLLLRPKVSLGFIFNRREVNLLSIISIKLHQKRMMEMADFGRGCITNGSEVKAGHLLVSDKPIIVWFHPVTIQLMCQGRQTGLSRFPGWKLSRLELYYYVNTHMCHNRHTPNNEN